MDEALLTLEDLDGRPVHPALALVQLTRAVRVARYCLAQGLDAAADFMLGEALVELTEWSQRRRDLKAPTHLIH